MAFAPSSTSTGTHFSVGCRGMKISALASTSVKLWPAEMPRSKSLSCKFWRGQRASLAGGGKNDGKVEQLGAGGRGGDSLTTRATSMCKFWRGPRASLAGGGKNDGKVEQLGAGGRGGDSLTTRATSMQQESQMTFVDGASIILADNVTSLVLVNRNDYECPTAHIGFGTLLDNGSLFRERFVIRYGEVTSRGTITLDTLASLLQEGASNHTIAMNYSFTSTCVGQFDGTFTPGRKFAQFDGNMTVTTRMHIEVDRYPVWRDLIEMDTWFEREGKNSVRRDWTLKDVKTGQIIATATSSWVLMNKETRKMTKMSDEKWAEIDPYLRRPSKWALSAERREMSSVRIPKLGDDVAYKTSGLIALEKDCDMKQHVNNIRYMGWLLESVPEDVKKDCEVSKITVEYRQEATRGQAVEARSEPEEAASEATRQFTHLIKTSESGKEINRGRTVWRPFLKPNF